jgi:hypothetical protein
MQNSYKTSMAFFFLEGLLNHSNDEFVSTASLRQASAPYST